MPSFPPQAPVPPTPAWQEIGRPSPEEAPVWTTWVALLGDAGDALYRSYVISEGAITISVELCRRQKPGAWTIHRARYNAPHDPVEAVEQVATLLKAADAAVAGTGKAIHSEIGMADKQGSLSQRASSPALKDGWNAMTDPRQEYEHHLRERAYFLWEREGRPEGHAHEFWERACQEEARAA